MKYCCMLILATMLAHSAHAQRIGIGTNNPDPQAILDIRDPGKGILIPRMDSATRKNIPATRGLLVFDSSYNSFWYHTGTQWQKLVPGDAGSTGLPKGSRAGDILYWNGTQWQLIPVGIPGQSLVVGRSGIPRWAAGTTDTLSTANAYFYTAGSNDVYKDYLGLIYARYAAIETPGGQRFIPNNDPDYDFFRCLFMLQEATTDEAVIAWQDPGVQPLVRTQFTPDNVFFRAMYLRLQDIIRNAGGFIRTTAPAQMNDLQLPATDLQRIKGYRAEARFLRALAYYYALDLFGGFEYFDENAPDDPAVKPPFYNRATLFSYVQSELQAIETDLAAPRSPGYGRADKACAWMLLAKLYLNAEVYTGTPRYTECLTYVNNIINTAQYSLSTLYQRLFLADNHQNGAEEEIIFPVVADGVVLPTYGNTTFIVHGATGGSMQPADLGIDGGWFGIRTRRECANIIDATGPSDTRNNLYKSGQSLDIADPAIFTQGYGVTKFRNKLANGSNSASLFFVNTDFPVFRLADVWLMYAECVLRGGTGGNINQAVNFMNYIRGRSGGGLISSSDLTLNYIFNERTRELYWECQRRTDLIRFGRFSGGSYLWQWKGDSQNGTATPAHTSLFPFPAGILATNPNVPQNPGY